MLSVTNLSSLLIITLFNYRNLCKLLHILIAMPVKFFFNQIIFQSLFNLKLIELPLSEM
jgi:hypothetical protein